MRGFLATAAAAVILTIASLPALATPLGAPTGVPGEINPIENIALCFYTDGWNGPGLYQCGYRHRRGEGWYGRREERRGYREDRYGRGDRDRDRYDRDRRPGFNIEIR
jgi:hypothetical protein